MMKSPGFTAVTILSLAIGIGANTSIFSAINAVLLRPLPFKDPDRLMTVDRTNPSAASPIAPWSYPKFEALRANNEVFEEVAAISNQSFPLTETDAPERLQVEMVSASYFPMLGVEASRGRTFAPEEDQTPGTHPVIVIGHGLWERRFGSDSSVIGQSVSLNKVRFNVIGVMPEGFKGQSGAVEAWVPMMMAPQLTFPRRLNITCTAIEVTGLIIVIAVGMRYWGSVDYFEFAPLAATPDTRLDALIASVRFNGARSLAPPV